MIIEKKKIKKFYFILVLLQDIRKFWFIIFDNINFKLLKVFLSN